jgi:hypothetical protein
MVDMILIAVYGNGAPNKSSGRVKTRVEFI